LVGTFFLLAFFFVNPPVRLIDDLTKYAKKYAEKPKDSSFIPLDKSTQDFLDVEHRKIIDEIKLRIEEQDSWFHYKFILIGGMVALFMGQLGFGKKESSTSDKASKSLKDIVTGESTYAILALSCVVALIIDMHIRMHNYDIQQLGLWIANFVEPSYVTPKDIAAGFRPWEQFLRTDDPAGMHLDNLHAFAYSFHLHFVSIFIYLLYAVVLQEVCLGFADNEKSSRQKMIVITGFVFVQSSALAFTFIAHAVPGSVTMKLLPFNYMANGWVSTAYYLVPLFFIVMLHLPYLLLIRKSAPNPLRK